MLHSGRVGAYGAARVDRRRGPSHGGGRAPPRLPASSSPSLAAGTAPPSPTSVIAGAAPPDRAWRLPPRPDPPGGPVSTRCSILPPAISGIGPPRSPAGRRRNGGGGGGGPSPQNLRNSPERRAKAKTEMCHFFARGLVCPYGDKCNYAHGEEELKFRHATVRQLERAGEIRNSATYLTRPCMTWVSTGACPFGSRCQGIHDPSIAGPVEAWLPTAVAKTNSCVIVDRLARDWEASVHQENPIVAQSVWEHCRPAVHAGYPRNEREWCDTYALVCNSGVPAFRESPVPTRPNAAQKLSELGEMPSELQKLCIVLQMRGGPSRFEPDSSSFQQHQDFVFSPTHSLHGELCMIFQVRYFYLPDVRFRNPDRISPTDIAMEIAFDEYQRGRGVRVTAHEVAFAPKGDPAANVSIWFDAEPVELDPLGVRHLKIAKEQKFAAMKKLGGFRGPHANGRLLHCASVAGFPARPPGTEPFVPMVSACDVRYEGQRLSMGILKHCIRTLIFGKCSFVTEVQKRSLQNEIAALRKDFHAMQYAREKWTWPKRAGSEHITKATVAPPGNTMRYVPSNRGSHCARTWHTFVKAIGSMNSPSSGPSARLSAYGARRDDGEEEGASIVLPRIASRRKNTEAGSSLEEDTWVELLHGREGGSFGKALHIYEKNKERLANAGSGFRNMPLSTLSFVQS